jgi:hypothetical protein
MSSRLTTLFVLLCSMIAGCGGGGGTTCTTDDQCASHFCKADGTCGMATVDAAPGSDGSGGTDGSAQSLCTPNHDGTISADEVPLAAGQMAKFRIATSATWNTAGHTNTDGSRTWDLTGQLANDADSQLALTSPAGTWWAADFAGATYATTLASGSDLQGVFKVDANSVTLLGVVSPTGGTYKTELTYDPAVKILALPFKAGDTWTSTSTVSGYAQGVIAAYTEKYDSSVDQVGTMATPYSTTPFPVLRVATNLTRTSGFTTLLTKRTFAWVAECFGTIAKVSGQDNDTSTEFSSDAEVERLAQ